MSVPHPPLFRACSTARQQIAFKARERETTCDRNRNKSESSTFFPAYQLWTANHLMPVVHPGHPVLLPGLRGAILRMGNELYHPTLGLDTPDGINGICHGSFKSIFILLILIWWCRKDMRLLVLAFDTRKLPNCGWDFDLICSRKANTFLFHILFSFFRIHYTAIFSCFDRCSADEPVFQRTNTIQEKRHEEIAQQKFSSEKKRDFERVLAHNKKKKKMILHKLISF